MEYFGLVFNQALFLFACFCFGFGEKTDTEMRLQTVTIDSMKGKKWEWIILYRQKFTFKHTFKDDELNRICGVFQPPDVEILEVYGRVIRFSLIRHTRQLFINVMFAVKYSVQVFLESIRTQQKAQCGVSLPAAKLLQFQIPRKDWPQIPEDNLPNDPQNESQQNNSQDSSQNNQDDPEPLKLIATDPQYFMKHLSPQWFPNQMTLNFVTHGRHVPLANKGLILVLLTGSFNISPRITTVFHNIHVLCSSNILTHRFVLLFFDDESANLFLASVAPFLTDQLPCPNDWMTPEILAKATTLVFPKAIR